MFRRSCGFPWTQLLERMLSECMDKASAFPDPRDVEVSVAAVHCAVEENVMNDYCV